MKTKHFKVLRGFYLPALIVGCILFFSSENKVFAQQGERQGQGQGQRQGQGQGQGQKRSPGENFDRTLKFLVDSIGIDAKQQGLVKAINAKYTKEMEALRSGNQQGGDREAMREKFKTLTQKYDAEIQAVLTKEQADKYKKSKAMRQKKAQENPRGDKSKSSNPQGRQRGGSN